MKDEDTFSNDGPPPTTSDLEGGDDSDDRARSSPPTVSQGTLSPAHPPRMERRITAHHRMRLLLVAIVVVLVALAGGYGVFRAVSPSSRQATSVFQQVTPCPFRLGAGLVEAQSVRCDWLTVPEDWSQPQGPTIRLAVAIFKTSSPHQIGSRTARTQTTKARHRRSALEKELPLSASYAASRGCSEPLLYPIVKKLPTGLFTRTDG